jgi:hypothetical protein
MNSGRCTPRNPRSTSISGKAKDGQDKGSKMKIARVLKSMMIAAIVAGALFLAPSAANAGVFVSVGIAPPGIPAYDQPLAPGYGYIWTPGYWAYGDDGYYWVDGAWVYPPYVDALWTPGYWGYGGGGYFWNAGYWGRHIGYYGGINYGFGYFGTGFWGGYWNGGHFFYNGAYNHIGFHNGFVYNHAVSGFNGRPGGNSFARNEGGGFNRGGENRGAGINGNSFANRGAANNNMRTGYASRGAAFNGGGARGYNGGGQTRSFSGGGNPGGAAHFSGGGGGSSFHGGGGGGGGFHGGGGGGGRGGGGGGGHR